MNITNRKIFFAYACRCCGHGRGNCGGGSVEREAV